MADVHPERSFAANVVHYVMKNHDNEWAPDPEQLRDGDSEYFTRMVKTAIDSLLNKNRTAIHELFNRLFGLAPSDVTEGHFVHRINSFKENLIAGGCFSDSFLRYCCYVSEFAVLAVARGFQDAPKCAITVIIQTVQSVRESGHLSNYFWTDIQNISLKIDSLTRREPL